MARTYFPNSEQFDAMNQHLADIAAAVGTQVDLSSRQGIRKAVLAGIAPLVMPVGTLFTVNHSVYGNRPWLVYGHDTHKNAANPDGHTMLVGPVPVLTTLQFDAPEAFFYADAVLAAGTYNFTIAQAYSSWAAGTYQFTLTQDLPKGGQLDIKNYAETAMTATKVRAFASRTTTTATEEVEITLGNEGTSLGTFGVELNHAHRVSYGSNNYKEGGYRQFANSEGTAGNVWTPQTKYDRPPSWVANTAGFLNGLEAEFKEIMCTAIVPCSTNNTYEAPDSTTPKNTRYELHDKVFALSNREVGFTADVDDGTTVLPFFKDATNADRIKYNTSNTAAIWWLRTPYSGSANNVRRVVTTGAMDGHIACNSYDFAPACLIG